MRILVTIAHYFSAEANSQHGSTSERKREDRQRAIEELICAYRGQFGVSATLHVGTKSFQPGVGSDDEIDIVAVTTGDKHLLTPDFCIRYRVKVAKLDLENPRMLGFGAQQIMAQQASKYDMFVFTEDDLRINDPTYFSKLVWFNQTYGPKRLLFPNRIEWNRKAPTLKTYIDGDLSQQAADRMNAYIDDENLLYGAPLGRQTVFRRARNPRIACARKAAQSNQRGIRRRPRSRAARRRHAHREFCQCKNPVARIAHRNTRGKNRRLSRNRCATRGHGDRHTRRSLRERRRAARLRARGERFRRSVSPRAVPCVVRHAPPARASPRTRIAPPPPPVAHRAIHALHFAAAPCSRSARASRGRRGAE